VYLWCLCLSSELPQQFQDSPLKWAMAFSFIILSSSNIIRNFEARIPSQLNVRLSLYLQSITFKSSVKILVMRCSELIHYALRKVIPRILLASSSKNLILSPESYKSQDPTRMWLNFFPKTKNPSHITEQHVKLYQYAIKTLCFYSNKKRHLFWSDMKHIFFCLYSRLNI